MDRERLWLSANRLHSRLRMIQRDRWCPPLRVRAMVSPCARSLQYADAAGIIADGDLRMRMCIDLLDEVVQILGQLGREAGNLEDAQDLGSSHGLDLLEGESHTPHIRAVQPTHCSRMSNRNTDAEFAAPPAAARRRRTPPYAATAAVA